MCLDEHFPAVTLNILAQSSAWIQFHGLVGKGLHEADGEVETTEEVKNGIRACLVDQWQEVSKFSVSLFLG